MMRSSAAGAPVLSVSESAHLAHTRARELWFTLEQDGANWPMLNSPMRLSKTPPRVTHMAPAVNQDSRGIAKTLGLDPRTAEASPA